MAFYAQDKGRARNRCKSDDVPEFLGQPVTSMNISLLRVELLRPNARYTGKPIARS